MNWNLWLLIGIIGQAAFFMRFMLQWIVSEKKKESVIPVEFWYFSLAGGVILLFYAVHKKDPVFILGQGSGVVIYLRNLFLIRKKHKEDCADTKMEERYDCQINRSEPLEPTL